MVVMQTLTGQGQRPIGSGSLSLAHRSATGQKKVSRSSANHVLCNRHREPDIETARHPTVHVYSNPQLRMYTVTLNFGQPNRLNKAQEPDRLNQTSMCSMCYGACQKYPKLAQAQQPPRPQEPTCPWHEGKADNKAHIYYVADIDVRLTGLLLTLWGGSQRHVQCHVHGRAWLNPPTV